MRFEIIREGFVTQCSGAVAVGPRCAALPSGESVCSCMLTRGLGTNDFLPMLYRSSDLGETWTPQGPIFPHLRERWSIFVSLSRDAAGRLFLFGSRTPIDRAGEPFWSEATQGIKQNESVHGQSLDGGWTWTGPLPIPMPIAGAAEAPGALCVTRTGRWLGPYSPYKTFDPNIPVARNQVVVVRSDDQGKTWDHAAMLHFADAGSSAAEAWVMELSDGRLLGTCWHIRGGEGGDYPNAFAISTNGGETWGRTESTGILGQSTGLAALSDGRALFVYNQRRHGEPGVWLAIARPTGSDFGLEANQIVWQAQRPTQRGTSGEHAQWGDFSFGEPAITPLPDETLLVTLWFIEGEQSGIRYVKIRCQS